MSLTNTFAVHRLRAPSIHLWTCCMPQPPLGSSSPGVPQNSPKRKEVAIEMLKRGKDFTQGEGKCESYQNALPHGSVESTPCSSSVVQTPYAFSRTILFVCDSILLYKRNYYLCDRFFIKDTRVSIISLFTCLL